MLRRSAWISLLLLAASPASSLPFEATAQKSASIPAAAFAPLVPSTTKRGDSGGALVVSGGVAGTFVAPIALADGSTIRSLSVVGVDNVDPGGIVARVLRVDRLEFGGTNPQVVAEAASTGTSAAVGTFATSAVTGGVVDAVRYYYYASVIVSPLTQVFGIRIGYDPPAAPGATKRLGIAGVTFEPRVSANSLKTSYLGILTTDSSSNESFVAPVQLPQGAVVSRFVFHARDFADINANARLVRVPVTAASGVAMAGLTSTGSDDAPREFSVSSIVNPTIDNVNNVYFAEIGVASSLEAYGVTIEYTGGASDTQDSPRGVSLLACVPASTVSDLRQPGATGPDALSGHTQFSCGLSLPDGALVSLLRINVRDGSAAGNAAVSLRRLGEQAPPAADVVGEVDSSGAGGAAAEYAQTIASPAAIDNAHNFYFVRVEQSTGIDTVGLRVSFALSPCADPDLDGFVTCGSCLLQPGQTCGDCDETRSTVFPGAPQVCDGINNDCSDLAWPALPAAEQDSDGDGISSCQGDCNDASPAIHPGATESCNGVDDNCSTVADEGFDPDGDGIGSCLDNCPSSANPAQSDRDGDGIGDACEAGASLTDVNHSGRVDGFDLIRLSRAFGAREDEPGYDSAADLDGIPGTDGKRIVDGADVALLAGSFGSDVTGYLGPPRHVTASAPSPTQVDLAWEDGSTGETGFRIDRADGSGGTFRTIGVVTSGTFQFHDTAVVPLGSYRYRVRAFNDQSCSAYSGEDDVETSDGLPAPPSDLVAEAASAFSIQLSWADHSADELGFRIERAPGGTSTFQEIAVVGPGVAEFLNAGLTTATSYSYRVRAYNAFGASGYTNVATATTQLSAPAAPSGLIATPLSTTQIKLDWTDNSAIEQGVEIERAPGGTSAFALLTSLPANATTYTNSGLSPGQSFSYRVRAYNATGASGYSNVATAASIPLPPGAPSGLSALALTSRSIRLNWTDNSANEDGFRVERAAVGGSFVLDGTVGAGVTTFTSTSLTPMTAYRYRVRAYNTGGDSSYSSEASTTTLVSYQQNVYPLFRPTCNSCHASTSRTATSANGLTFALGLLDTYYEITNGDGQEAHSRVNVASPDSSILLQYPARTEAGANHSGGAPWPTTSTSYQTIRRWILEGAQNNN